MKTAHSKIDDSKIIPPVLVFALAFATFFPALGYDFTYDDFWHIRQNAYVYSADTSLSQVLSIFAQATDPGDLYRPVTILSLRLNYLYDSFSPFFYHFFNNFFHGLVSALVFFLVFNLAKDRFLAFIVGIIFAIHPVHIEAVANVYGRNEVLAAFFALLSTLVFAKGVSTQKYFACFSISAVLYLFALFSKESALPLLAIAPLYALFIDRDWSLLKKRPFMLGCLGLLATSLLYMGLRYFVLQEKFFIGVPTENYHSENALFHYSFVERIFPSLYLAGEYLRMLFLPLKFSADYSFPHDFFFNTLLKSPTAYITILSTFIFACIVFMLYKSKSFFWGLWLFLSFSITINLFVTIGTLMAERLAYFPSIGFTAWLVFAYSMLSKKLVNLKPLLILLAAVYIVFLNVQTHKRMPVWQDNLTLFQHSIHDNQKTSKMAFNLAVYYVEEGKLEQAITYFKEAHFRDTTMALPVKNIIVNLIRLKQYHRARFWTKKYLEVVKDDDEINRINELLNSI